MITRDIQRGERAQQYVNRRCTVVGLRDDVHHAITDVNGVTDETLLFAFDDLDLVSDLDSVLRISKSHRAAKG